MCTGRQCFEARSLPARENFELARAVDEREARFAEFQARPMIRERMAKGELLVKWMDIDTRTERLAPHAGN